MSVTTLPTRSQSVPPEPADVFDVIWDDPTICNGCFERIRQRITYDPDELVSDYAPTEDICRAYRGVGEQHPEDLPTSSQSTWCGDCGSEHGRAGSDTLSKQAAIDQCDDLAARIEERGIAIDREHLRYVVGSGKSRPALEAYDTEIYRLAVRLAVQRADS